MSHRIDLSSHCLHWALALALVAVASLFTACSPDMEMPNEQHADPLPSWNDGPSRQAIIDFVEAVTDSTSDAFVPVGDRIATFDNDGTLWGEQPMYVQLAFTLDQVRALAPQHPEWESTEPFASVLRGDVSAVMKGGVPTLLQLVMATHAGMPTEEFTQTVNAWLDTARHPVSGRSYTEMVYQPMLEVLDYLRDHGFTTYIISAGGMEFMRAWSTTVYGIPPSQVYGSRIKVVYDAADGNPTLRREAEIEHLNDGHAKPEIIQQNIGRQPIAAFGNSDGDREMLEWTTSGKGARLGVLIHHTDDAREVAYDRGSPIGGLDKAWDQAESAGWVLVDMKDEWKMLYPFEVEGSR